MKIKIRRKIGLQDLLMWVGLLCVLSYALLEHASIPIPAISAIKMPLIYMGGFCVVSQMNVFLRNVLKKQYFYVLMALLLLCIFLLFSMFRNRNALPGVSVSRSTMRLVLYLCELFVLMIIFAEKGQSRAAIRLTYFYVLVLVALSDILMFSGLVRFGVGKHENYLVGTKFSVVYMHFNLLALWLVQHAGRNKRKRGNKWGILAVAVMFVLISIRVNCMTGVLGSFCLAVLLVWIYSGKKRAKIFTSPTVLVLCIIACTVFAFVIGFVLDIPFVISFLENVLGRDTTLTGRVDIYNNYAKAMHDHWLLGYGYGSGNLISVRFFGCANAQNAILHWILQSGILTTAMLVALIVMIIKQIKMHGLAKHDAIEPLLALIYTYIFLGTVETTYSMSFILWIALLFLSTNDTKEEMVPHVKR